VIGPLFAAAVLSVLVVALCLLLVGVGLAVRGWAWLTGWLANVERARARTLLAAETPRLPGPERSPSGSWFAGALPPLRSSRLWRETGFLTLQMLAGPLALVMVLLVWLVPVGLMAGPVWWWAAGRGTHGVATWVPWPVALGVGCVGLLLLGLAPRAVRQVGRALRRLAEATLGPAPRELLRQRIVELEHSRHIAVAAAEAERRRLERDLHDGAQARVVALAVQLGLAAEILAELVHTETGAEPVAAAAALVEDARRHALTVVDELRDLARGLHPSVLSARGLHAALTALAAFAPLPVTVDVDDSLGPLPAELEAAVYYAIAEVVTNAVKHAHAGNAQIHIARRDRLLTVQVSDDGRGGASARPGGGLAGVAERLAPLDGWLELTSAPGRGTRVRIAIPLPADVGTARS
jgi:signal transduction histidine kinase